MEREFLFLETTADFSFFPIFFFYMAFSFAIVILQKNVEGKERKEVGFFVFPFFPFDLIIGYFILLYFII